MKKTLSCSQIEQQLEVETDRRYASCTLIVRQGLHKDMSQARFLTKF